MVVRLRHLNAVQDFNRPYTNDPLGNEGTINQFICFGSRKKPHHDRLYLFSKVFDP